MGGLNMPFVLILEALAKAAIEFYVAIEAITKIAISAYTLYKIGSKIYKEICDE